MKWNDWHTQSMLLMKERLCKASAETEFVQAMPSTADIALAGLHAHFDTAASLLKRLRDNRKERSFQATNLAPYKPEVSNLDVSPFLRQQSCFRLHLLVDE